MSHILDDFIFFGPFGSSKCATVLESSATLADSLNIPLRTDKTVLPSRVVFLHGIEIDTNHMQMRLPHDKPLDARSKIDGAYKCKKVALRQMQCLIGTLNFACKVITAGRTFLRRLIDGGYITRIIYCVSILRRGQIYQRGSYS